MSSYPHLILLGDHTLAQRYVPFARSKFNYLYQQFAARGRPIVTRTYQSDDFVIQIWISATTSTILIEVDRSGILQGFICLPASDLAPEGWGKPYTDDEGEPINPPLGTPGGDEPKVILDTGNYPRIQRLTEDVYKKFLTKDGPQLGNVTWHSADEKIVISWKGPANRYVVNISFNTDDPPGPRLAADVFGTDIYMHGVVLAQVQEDYLVLGAAVRRHPMTQKLELVAVLRGSTENHVVIAITDFPDPKKVNKKHKTIIQWTYLAEQQLPWTDGSFELPDYTQRGFGYWYATGWFFNSTGTKANCFRGANNAWDPFNNSAVNSNTGLPIYEMREMEMDIQDGSFVVTDLGNKSLTAQFGYALEEYPTTDNAIAAAAAGPVFESYSLSQQAETEIESPVGSGNFVPYDVRYTISYVRAPVPKWRLDGRYRFAVDYDADDNKVYAEFELDHTDVEINSNHPVEVNSSYVRGPNIDPADLLVDGAGTQLIPRTGFDSVFRLVIDNTVVDQTYYFNRLFWCYRDSGPFDSINYGYAGSNLGIGSAVFVGYRTDPEPGGFLFETWSSPSFKAQMPDREEVSYQPEIIRSGIIEMDLRRRSVILEKQKLDYTEQDFADPFTGFIFLDVFPKTYLRTVIDGFGVDSSEVDSETRARQANSVSLSVGGFGGADGSIAIDRNGKLFLSAGVVDEIFYNFADFVDVDETDYLFIEDVSLVQGLNPRYYPIGVL